MEHPIGATFRFCFLLIKDKRHFFDGVYTFSLFFFHFAMYITMTATLSQLRTIFIFCFISLISFHAFNEGSFSEMLIFERASTRKT